MPTDGTNVELGAVWPSAESTAVASETASAASRNVRIVAAQPDWQIERTFIWTKHVPLGLMTALNRNSPHALEKGPGRDYERGIRVGKGHREVLLTGRGRCGRDRRSVKEIHRLAEVRVMDPKESEICGRAAQARLRLDESKPVGIVGQKPVSQDYFLGRRVDGAKDSLHVQVFGVTALGPSFPPGSTERRGATDQGAT
jgi:hypothetical protein